MKKRLFTLSAALVLVLGLCACGKTDLVGPGGEDGDNDGTTDTEPGEVIPDENPDGGDDGGSGDGGDNNPGTDTPGTITLTWDATSYTVQEEEAIPYNYTVSPTDANVTIWIGDTSIASINTTPGYITGVKAGETEIHASAELEGYTSLADVSVPVYVTEAEIPTPEPEPEPSPDPETGDPEHTETHTYVVPLDTMTTEDHVVLDYVPNEVGHANANKGKFTVGFQENTFDNPTAVIANSELQLNWTPAATAGVINWNAVEVAYELPDEAGFDATLGANYTITMDIYTEVACTAWFNGQAHTLNAGMNQIKDEQGNIGVVETNPNFTLYFAPENTPADFPQTNYAYISYLAFDYTPHIVETIPVTGISFDEGTKSLALNVDDTYDLASHITITPTDATNQNYSLSISGEYTDYFDLTGTVLTAKKTTSESFTLTVSLDGYSDTASISVNPVAVTGVTIGEAAKSIALVVDGGGFDIAPYVTVSPDNATDPSYAITLSDTSETYARLDDTTVYGVSATTDPVTLTVTTTDGGHTDTASITVTAATVAVTGITIDDEYQSVELEIGEEFDFASYIHVQPDNATDQNYSVSISDTDETYVSLSGTTVTGVSATEEPVTLTASIGEFSATASITVKAAENENPDIDPDETHTYIVDLASMNDSDNLYSSQNPFGDAPNHHNCFTYMYMDSFIEGQTWFEHERLNMSWSTKQGATGVPWSAITLTYKLPTEHAMADSQGANFRATLHIYVEQDCNIYFDNIKHELKGGEVNIIYNEQSNYGSASTTPDMSLYFGVEADAYVCGENTIYISYLAFDWS